VVSLALYLLKFPASPGLKWCRRNAVALQFKFAPVQGESVGFQPVHYLQRVRIVQWPPNKLLMRQKLIDHQSRCKGHGDVIASGAYPAGFHP
jgi:hypothetical protein